MVLTNYKIYELAQFYILHGTNINMYIPAKANFYIQKNIELLQKAALEIEKVRLGIAEHYGIYNADKEQYDIPPEKQSEAVRELEDLFNIEQDLDIKTFSIEALGDAKFTPAQMQAIMFMIED